jgi:hypothetical protein
MVKKGTTRFSSDLRACVATYDPDRLQNVRAEKEYRIYGWFPNQSRTDTVIHCMQGRGYIVAGPALYVGSSQGDGMRCRIRHQKQKSFCFFFVRKKKKCSFLKKEPKNFYFLAHPTWRCQAPAPHPIP